MRKYSCGISLSRYHLDRHVISLVRVGSDAKRVGLERNDEIVEIDGRPVIGLPHVEEMLVRDQDERVALVVIRGDSILKFDVKADGYDTRTETRCKAALSKAESEKNLAKIVNAQIELGVHYVIAGRQIEAQRSFAECLRRTASLNSDDMLSLSAQCYQAWCHFELAARSYSDESYKNSQLVSLRKILEDVVKFTAHCEFTDCTLVRHLVELFLVSKVEPLERNADWLATKDLIIRHCETILSRSANPDPDLRNFVRLAAINNGQRSSDNTQSAVDDYAFNLIDTSNQKMALHQIESCLKRYAIDTALKLTRNLKAELEFLQQGVTLAALPPTLNSRLQETFGLVYERYGDLESALVHYKLMKASAGLMAARCQAAALLGRVSLKLGASKDALAYFEEALAATEDSTARLQWMLEIAKIYDLLNDHDACVRTIYDINREIRKLASDRTGNVFNGCCNLRADLVRLLFERRHPELIIPVSQKFIELGLVLVNDSFRVFHKTDLQYRDCCLHIAQSLDHLALVEHPRESARYRQLSIVLGDEQSTDDELEAAVAALESLVASDFLLPPLSEPEPLFHPHVRREEPDYVELFDSEPEFTRRESPPTVDAQESQPPDPTAAKTPPPTPPPSQNALWSLRLRGATPLQNKPSLASSVAIGSEVTPSTNPKASMQPTRTSSVMVIPIGDHSFVAAARTIHTIYFEGALVVTFKSPVNARLSVGGKDLWQKWFAEFSEFIFSSWLTVHVLMQAEVLIRIKSGGRLEIVALRALPCPNGREFELSKEKFENSIQELRRSFEFLSGVGLFEFPRDEVDSVQTQLHLCIDTELSPRYSVHPRMSHFRRAGANDGLRMNGLTVESEGPDLIIDSSLRGRRHYRSRLEGFMALGRECHLLNPPAFRNLLKKTQTVFESMALYRGGLDSVAVHNRVAFADIVALDKTLPGFVGKLLRLALKVLKRRPERKPALRVVHVVSEVRVDAASLESFASAWNNPFASSSISDDAVEGAIEQVYRHLGLRKPKVTFCLNPFKMLDTLANSLDTIDGIANGPKGKRKKTASEEPERARGPQSSLAIRNSIREELLLRSIDIPVPGSDSLASIQARFTDRPLEVVRRQCMRVLPTHATFRALVASNFRKQSVAGNAQAPMGSEYFEAHLRGVRTLIWGPWESLPLGPAAFLSSCVDATEHEPSLIDALKTIHLSSLFVIFTKKAAIVCGRPLEAHLDERGRLHNFDGPAILFRDSAPRYMWHGVEVTAAYAGAEVTAERIDGEHNAELRGLLLERFGLARYMDEVSEIIHSDEYGTLLARRLPDTEPIVMVKVKNSTAEPDGTFRTYLLRVPPTMTTAREAIAWTFDMGASDYNPDIET